MRRYVRLLMLAPLLAAAGCPRSAGPGDRKPAEPAWLEDVTGKVGLNFVHDAGPIDDRFFLPQITGSGAAAFDFDGDGRLDLYLINNGGPKGAKNRLFHQEPDGTFKDVSAGSGLDVAGYGQGVTVGDVNNDGLPDVLLTEYGSTRLFLNLGGGKFRDVTKEAGLNSPLWATSAAFFDYDRDGLLDLVVANYVDYEAGIRCPKHDAGEYCGPNWFKGTPSSLYHNLGPGPDGVPRFEDVSVKSGLAAAPGKGLGVLCADFNGDGWPDIFIANDMSPNHLWINRKDGTFAEQAAARGLAYPASGQPAANMGIAWGDIDGGLPSLFVTHIDDELHTLWQQGPPGFYQDRTVGAGLNSGGRSTGWGAAFVDFDCDGRPDLLWVNGAIRRSQIKVTPESFWPAYAQHNQIFINTGGGKFREISDANPAFCGYAAASRGLLVADFSNRGVPDIVTTEIAGPVRVFRNVAPNRGHWLTVRALLPTENRDAHGAEVTVRAGGKSFWRLVNPNLSYCCSGDPRCHFGLGALDRYDEIRVQWPNGSAEIFCGGTADRHVVLRKGDGKKE